MCIRVATPCNQASCSLWHIRYRQAAPRGRQSLRATQAYQPRQRRRLPLPVAAVPAGPCPTPPPSNPVHPQAAALSRTLYPQGRGRVHPIPPATACTPAVTVRLAGPARSRWVGEPPQARMLEAPSWRYRGLRVLPRPLETPLRCPASGSGPGPLQALALHGACAPRRCLSVEATGVTPLAR